MPAQNGTGPQGLGPMTGRGFGLCRQISPTRCQFCTYPNQPAKATEKDQKQFLEQELKRLQEEEKVVKEALGKTK